MASKSALISKSAFAAAIALSWALLGSGCDSPDAINALVDQASALLGIGSKPPQHEVSKDAQAEADLELIGEMYRVIFVRDSLSTSERDIVSHLAETLNQGASLEGLYNGLTHSASYRKLEVSHQGTSPEALRTFANQLASLEVNLPAPTAFDPSAAEPLAEPVEPSYRPIDPNSPDAREDRPTAAPSTSPSDPAALAKGYSDTFAHASFFTLKRVTGDEALKVVSAHATSPEKLALWYSKWAVQMAGLGIDFGLKLRNSTDENFHYRWALGSTPDQVKWEVLNRVHRVLNKKD